MPPSRSQQLFNRVSKDVKKAKDPVSQIQNVLNHSEKLCKDEDIEESNVTFDDIIKNMDKIDQDLLVVLHTCIHFFIKQYGKEGVDEAVEKCELTDKQKFFYVFISSMAEDTYK